MLAIVRSGVRVPTSGADGSDKNGKMTCAQVFVVETSGVDKYTLVRDVENKCRILTRTLAEQVVQPQFSITSKSKNHLKPERERIKLILF
ncbi:hypothetical protein Y032_0026g1489 [Ancylostoma ceylanicum]|uniref:Uncharacterized protein n=1 Tax=Ancylostoma ceylanicum TaxID=53326 RepID=A0A016UWX6_9BILA|nr:hypothetical protein Y032_0026g1489 [Ancylostoma ceylanicum]